MTSSPEGRQEAEVAIDHPCPICLKPFEPADLCATDIELGTCHAACLEGSPTVDLETGDPVDGPTPTYLYDEEAKATFTISIFESRSTLHIVAASGTNPDVLLARAKATLSGEEADLEKCPFHLPPEIDLAAYEAARNSFVMAEHRRGHITRKVLTAYIAALQAPATPDAQTEVEK